MYCCYYYSHHDRYHQRWYNDDKAHRLRSKYPQETSRTEKEEVRTNNLESRKDVEEKAAAQIDATSVDSVSFPTTTTPTTAAVAPMNSTLDKQDDFNEVDVYDLPVESDDNDNMTMALLSMMIQPFRCRLRKVVFVILDGNKLKSDVAEV